MLRNRKGFTLIELLIVVVIIGILAAIALPKFGQTRERAYQSAMKSDLRNFQTQAEMYYNDNYAYPAAGTDIPYQWSDGVAPTFTAGAISGGIGYQVTLDHTGLDPAQDCWLFVSQDPEGENGITCNAL